MTSHALVPGDPQRIGEHLLAGRLGQGGQGVVYDGYDATGQRVAIKLLHADADRSRVAREISAATKVSSFCTARILGADLDADRPYIVSEFIDGQSLRTAVRSSGPLDPGRLHRLAVAVATALTAIHAAGVVHRDLKPDNVLLGPDGPRVIDFGIARTAEAPLTSTGLVAGTPTYMAPEVFTGRRAETPADVFAWAAVVLFAATGSDPFHAESLGAVMYRVLSTQPDLSGLPETLRPLVSAALAKEPGDRPDARGLLLGLLGQDDPAEGVRVAGDLKADAEPSLGLLAEEIFGRLAPAEQEVVPEIFLRLVSLDDGGLGVRSADRSELGEGATVERVLRDFASAGLLREETRDGETLVRPSRPGLLLAWGRLREWVDAERDGLPVQQRVSRAARLWESGGRRDADLPQGTMLEEAMAWAATGRRHLTLNPLEAAYLRAAAALGRRRGRNRRLVTTALAALLAVAVGAVVVAEQRRVTVAQQSERIAGQLGEAVARRLAGQADAIRQADPATAMKLSVAAHAVAPVREALGALRGSIDQRETSVVPQPEPGLEYTLSADGTQLTGASGDGVSFWDAGTGVKSSPGSGLAALVPAPGGHRLWDGAREGLRPATYGDANTWSEFGQTGRRLMTMRGREFVVWDVPTGAALLRVPHADVLGRALGGDLFATTSLDGHGVRLYDLSSGRALPVPELPADLGKPDDVALSADDRTMVVQADGRMVFLDLASGRRIGETSGPEGQLRFAPDGRSLAVRHNDGVDLLSVPGGATLLNYRTEAQPQAGSLRFTPGGEALRFLDASGAVITLDVSGTAAGARVGKGTVAAGALSPDGRLAAVQTVTGTAPVVEVWDVAKGVRRARVTLPQVPRADNGFVEPLFSPDGRTLAISQNDAPRVLLWDLAAGRERGRLRWDGKSGSSMAFDPTGSRLAVASLTKADQEVVTVWDTTALTSRSTAATGAVGLAFSRDGGLLARGGVRAGLTTLGTGRSADLPGTADVRVLAFSGELLAVGDQAGRVQFWDLAGRSPRGPAVQAHPGGVELAAFSPDGKVLATAGGGRTVLWDAATGGRLGQPAAGAGQSMLDLIFTGGGTRALMADGTVLDRPLDPAEMTAEVCRRTGTGLTEREWRTQVPELPYRRTCPR
ncbi:protein kinase domain-containing protein [Streptosporangium soli]|nr:serine/threonine-protein kinase [Streptosporangium sp. KLBMP 9127]